MPERKQRLAFGSAVVVFENQKIAAFAFKTFQTGKKKPPERVAKGKTDKERKPVRVKALRAALAVRISGAEDFCVEVCSANARIIRS
ncbi:hypothetical protein [Pseudomonas fluorescens]|uniref:hypothetical protein n=1 Tax=Pseudomonas fluorescens TaxID=294 RepID=UPI0005AC9EEE|nr:hypothetical protein [Pseudomonas fluorescens]